MIHILIFIYFLCLDSHLIPHSLHFIPPHYLLIVLHFTFSQFILSRHYLLATFLSPHSFSSLCLSHFFLPIPHPRLASPLILALAQLNPQPRSDFGLDLKPEPNPNSEFKLYLNLDSNPTPSPDPDLGLGFQSQP